jgi:hypothetical protein
MPALKICFHLCVGGRGHADTQQASFHLPLLTVSFRKRLTVGFKDHHPIRIGDEQERLVAASLVMTKSRAPAGGNNYPENGLVKPPRRDTTSPQPSRYVRRKGAAPHSGAEEKTSRAFSAYAQCACLLPLHMDYKLD